MSCIIQKLLNSLILRTPKHQNRNLRKHTSCLPKQLLKMATKININSSWLSHNDREKLTDKISNYHLIAYTAVLSLALSCAEELRITVRDIIFLLQYSEKYFIPMLNHSSKRGQKS